MNTPSCFCINGRIVPEAEAHISVMDRGFLFGDGVYDVIAVLDGQLIDWTAHIHRLYASMKAIGIAPQSPPHELEAFALNILGREGLQEGLLYIQITRGVQPRRSFAPPATSEVESTCVLFCQATAIRSNPLAVRGAHAITVPDLRWARRDIKSTSLLAQVLAKQQAVQANVDEAWMVEDGIVTEASSAAAFIITPDHVLITRPVATDMLDSITGRVVRKLAKQLDLDLEARPFSVQEALQAAEAFSASATALIIPVISLDGKRIGTGTPGPWTAKLRETYLACAHEL